MAITFTTNNDGSLSVTFTASAVNWSLPAGTDVSSYYSANGNLPNMSPDYGGSGSSGGPAPCVQDVSGVPFVGHLGLHLQYGTDTANTFKDYFIQVPLTDTETSAAIGGSSETIVTAIAHPGGTLSYTIPASALADARAVNGIYAIGYVALVWGPLQTGDPTPTGWMEIECAVGTNAPTGQSQPPSTPTNVQGTVNADLSVSLSWSQSIPGTAPLAGYTVKWGTTAGGPYSSALDFPIANYPPATTPTFKATIPGSNFAQDGQYRYFTVQAFDDGTAPATSSFASGVGISYWPTPPAIVPKTPPSGTPPGGTPSPGPISKNPLPAQQ